LCVSACLAACAAAGPAGWVDRFAGKPRKGCDILVQALEREGVETGEGGEGCCGVVRWQQQQQQCWMVAQ